MRVKTIVRFRDMEEDVIREVGEMFSCSEERYQEILAKGEFVEEAPEEGPGEPEGEPKDQKEAHGEGPKGAKRKQKK